MRYFEQTTSKAFETRELPKEETARRKRRRPSTKGKLKEFNLTTFKFHALGHHANFIRQVGTSDNFTTQTVYHIPSTVSYTSLTFVKIEGQHKNPKLHAKRASKSKKLLAPGISRQHIRSRAVYLAKQAHLREKRKGKFKGNTTTRFSFFDSERLPRTDPAVHHHISKERLVSNRVHLLEWTRDNIGDPALTGFIRRLRSYLLAKILSIEFDDDENQFNDDQMSRLIILNDTIYRHKVLRINYTTYDLRRQQDSINPRTQADVMLLSNDESSFPYWYARVLGIFHAQIVYMDPITETMQRSELEFLWVRWFGLNSSPRHGWAAKNLPRVGFINERVDRSPAFGFIDPSQVIRAVHLIPDETGGKSRNGLLRPTIARKSSDEHLDWNYFFVNMCAPDFLSLISMRLLIDLLMI
ncbi:hypothetical protein BJ165DRAFT_1397314 [Panaeolus papilionaceus]|nr:hypothetical protein BJ165DRAFT_1397314 [Panaeolus papilionaceus]